jgi:uncharacterized membrane protein YfcA
MNLTADLPPWAYPLFFAAGLTAGTVDAIAGGGGLITLPVLMGLGLPVPLALGTNKLGAVFGSGAATLSFMQRGLVSLRECAPGVALTALGALAGAAAVRRLDPDFLAKFVPWLLAVMVVYMAFRPRLGEASRRQRLGRPAFYLLAGLGLGFYDGFFGPGVGSFWTIAFILLLGHDFLQAAAHTKLMNFTSNAAALAFFAWSGAVLLVPGLVMGAGQLLGGRLGAHLAVTRGARFIRPIFLVMAGLTVLKLLYQHFLRA